MGDVGSTPQFEAPTLAMISNAILARPSWASHEPVYLGPELFERALDEMTLIQKNRGFPVAQLKIEIPNFLLRGVPVVISG